MGLRLGGEKLKLKQKRYKRKGKQCWLVCTHLAQKNETDKRKETRQKMRHKDQRKNGCERQRGQKREEKNTGKGENQ